MWAMNTDHRDMTNGKRESAIGGTAGFWGIANLSARGIYLMIRLGIVWSRAERQKKRALLAFEQSLAKSGIPAEDIPVLVKAYHDAFDLSGMFAWRGKKNVRKRFPRGI